MQMGCNLSGAHPSTTARGSVPTGRRLCFFPFLLIARRAVRVLSKASLRERKSPACGRQQVSPTQREERGCGGLLAAPSGRLHHDGARAAPGSSGTRSQAVKQPSHVLAALCPHHVWFVGSDCASGCSRREPRPHCMHCSKWRDPAVPGVPASEPGGMVRARGVAQHSRAPCPWGAGHRAECAPGLPALQGNADVPVQAGEASCGIEANEKFINLRFCRR